MPRKKKAEKNADKPKGDKNKARVADMDADATAAANIIAQGTPSQITKVTTNEGKKALAARLDAIVAEAERQDIKVRKQVRGSVPASLMYLSDARTIANRIKSNNITYAEINQFLTDEFDLRSGGGDMMRQRRKEEGDAKMNRRVVNEAATADDKLDSGRIEGAKEVKAAADEVIEDDRGGGGSALVDTRTEESDDQTDTTSPDEEDDIIPPSMVRDRPPVKIEEDSVRGYAGVKEGTVKTERVVGGRRKLNVPLNVPKGVSILKKAPNLSTQQVNAEVDRPLAGFTGDVYDAMAEAQANAGRSTDVATILAELPATQNHYTSVDRAMSAFISKRIAGIVGDVPVHVVSPDRMARLYGVDEDQIVTMSPGEIPGGLYFPGEHAIYINSELPSTRTRVILHEAVHAATVKTMDKDAELRSEIRTLMSLVKNGNIGNQYGMKNEYEFLAEAMSNPEFQTMLRYVELPPDVARQYGLHTGRILRTAWDFFVNSIRRALGFPAGVYTALDAALRLSD